jgi:NitT/TauT family transport system substrate-binding protein
VRGLVRVINRAVVEIAANPSAGMAVLQRVEPLLKAEIEQPRLVYFLEKQMITPETTALGIGDIEDRRMANAIATVADAYGLARKPELKEVFDRSFLPPKSERELTMPSK